MKKVFKIVLIIVYVIDILLIPTYVYMLKWWEREHNRPGLAEMTDGQGIVAGLIIKIIVFIVLTVVFIVCRKTRARKGNLHEKSSFDC